MITWNYVKLLVEIKLKKTLEPKIGPEIRFFVVFSILHY